jgi:hypothetical protein
MDDFDEDKLDAKIAEERNDLVAVLRSIADRLAALPIPDAIESVTLLREPIRQLSNHAAGVLPKIPLS